LVLEDVLNMDCQHEETKVVESRKKEDGRVCRRRVCEICGHRFSTVEIPVEEYLKFCEFKKNLPTD
jgi:transcriptional regulator NrdR family protein